MFQLCRDEALLKVLFIFSVFLFSSIKLSKSACFQKKFDADSFVCVCNITHCDTIEPTKLPNYGFASLYTSDAFNLRLHYQRVMLSELKNQGNSDVVIRVNKSNPEQEIFGFGGALTDSSCLNIKSLPEPLQRKFIQDYFSPTNGVNYVFVRIPMAVSDFSTRTYTYDDVHNDFDLQHFALANEDINCKIPILKEIKNHANDLKLFGAAWFPPSWLLDPEGISIGGKLKGPVGDKYYQIWANYYIKFLNAYRDMDLPFWGISNGNEPNFGNTDPEVTTPFDPVSLASFVNINLGPTLKKSGYTKDNFNLLIGDDPSGYIEEDVKQIMANQSAKEWVSGIAFHWYFNFLTGYDNYKKMKQDYPDLFLLSTEASITEETLKEKVSLGNWTRAQQYAQDIIQTLNVGSSGWVDWNILLDGKGGPSRLAKLDATVITFNQSFYRQPMFYALAHFSKFILPGAKHLRTTYDIEDSKVLTTAALNPDNTIVLVVLNQSDEEKLITIKGISINPSELELKSPPKSILTLIKQFL